MRLIRNWSSQPRLPHYKGLMRMLIIDDDGRARAFVAEGLRQQAIRLTKLRMATRACTWRLTAPMTPLSRIE